MKRQHYFPKTVPEQSKWFGNFATQLGLANAVLALPAPVVAAIIADARFCEYACGLWLNAEIGRAHV